MILGLARVLLVAGAARAAVPSRTRNATRLKDSLIGNAPLMGDDADYDPTIAGASPAVIEFDLNLISITELSAMDESFVIETWWRHWWRDERLTWDPADFGGVGKLMLDTAEVWYPDIAAWVLLEEPMPTMKNKAKLEVTSDGQLFISTPRRDVVQCEINLARFPFDTQKCHFTIGSWNAPEDSLEVRARAGTKGVDLKYFVESKEYQLIGIDVTAQVEYYSCCPEPFRTLVYEFEIRRYAITYVTSIIIPLISTTFIGFSAFALNPASGERVGLCTTVLLTTAAIYIVAAEMIPKVGHWTLLSRLYFVCLLANLFTFLVTCVSIMLTMLSNQAESNRDFWGLPVFNRLVDYAFWRLHVGVMLRRKGVGGGKQQPAEQQQQEDEEEDEEDEKQEGEKEERETSLQFGMGNVGIIVGEDAFAERDSGAEVGAAAREGAEGAAASARAARPRLSTMTGAADGHHQRRRSLSKVGLHKVRHAQGDHKRVAAALVQTWDGGGARKGLAGGRHDLTSAELLLYMKNWYMRCAGFLDQVCFFLMPALFTVYLACEFVNVGSEYPSRLNHFGFKPSSVSMPHVNLYESGTVAPSAAP